MEQHSHFPGSTPEWLSYLPLLLIGGLTLIYIILSVSIPKEKKAWNKWRILSFVFGMLLLSIAVHPSILKWGHMDMRGHMVQHLLIAMYAPILLVLGAPLTLLLKALPVKLSRKATNLLRSSIFFVLSHPFFALFLNIGGMYVLYLTPLYNLSLTSPALHYVIHFHFLAAGYLFTWSIINQDPVSKKPPIRVKIIALFLGIAAHAYLSKFMYAYLYPLNSPHTDEQIQAGAKLMYYWGDLAELFLVIILFSTWYNRRNRTENSAIFPQ